MPEAGGGGGAGGGEGKVAAGTVRKGEGLGLDGDFGGDSEGKGDGGAYDGVANVVRDDDGVIPKIGFGHGGDGVGRRGCA